MIGRLRLVDAVVIAAVAVLGLKLIALVAGPKPEVAPAPGADGLPAFGRAIAYARTNYLPPDVTTTGSVPAKKEEKAEAPPPEPPKPKPPGFEPAPPSVSPSERALLERLGERRDELQQRSSDLEMRERLIENAEKKLEGRINELKTMEGKATEDATKRGETEAAGLKNLVIMYEAMKPKDAARVFDRLSLEVLVPVVMQMKPAKMADVLAVMAPEAAEKLTVALALRARGAKAADPKPPAAGAQSGNELPSIDQPSQGSQP